MSPDRTQVIGERWDIARCEMHTYLTPDFFDALEEWKRFKRYGLRFDGGWATQPAPYIDLLNIFEEEYNRWEKKKLNDK